MPLAFLKHALVNVTTELTSHEIEDTSIWKKFVSGERHAARNPYEQYRQNHSTCKHVSLANMLPHFKKGNEADSDRINLIELKRQFSKEEQDVNLEEKLRPERDGIFRQLVRRVPKILNLSALPEGGVGSRSCKARMGIRITPTGAFVRECTVLGPNYKCLKRDLIWAYRRFMTDNMMEHLIANDFKYAWLAQICDDHKISCSQPREVGRKRVLNGIALNDLWRATLRDCQKNGEFDEFVNIC